MKQVVSLGLALVIGTVAAYAYPTLAGPTGMGVLPTADVVGNGAWNIAADYYDSNDSTVPIRALYGIGRTFELGASYRSGDQVAAFIDGLGLVIDDGGFEQGFFPVEADVSIEDMWGINGKWVTGLTLGGFCWSLGAQYLQGDLSADGTVEDDLGNIFPFSGDAGDYKATQIYFVGTRNFSDMCPCPPDTIVRGSLGVNWTKVEYDFDSVDFVTNGVDPTVDLEDFDLDEDDFRFFLGLDVIFDRFYIAGEYQTDASDLGEDDGLYGVTARYAFSDALAGQVGYTNEVGGVLGGDEGNFFVGLNYAFSTENLCY